MTRAGDDKASVTVTAVEPPWKPYVPHLEEVRGGQMWELVLLPGVPKTVTASYTIEISSRNELTGGNRREAGYGHTSY